MYSVHFILGLSGRDCNVQLQRHSMPRRRQRQLWFDQQACQVSARLSLLACYLALRTGLILVQLLAHP